MSEPSANRSGKLRLALKALAKSEDGKFAADTIKNVARFCGMAGAALVLQLIARWLEKQGVNPFEILVLTWVSHAILIADAIRFTARLIVDTWKIIKSTYREITHVEAGSTLKHDNTP